MGYRTSAKRRLLWSKKDMSHSDTLSFKREVCILLGVKKHDIRVYCKGKDMLIRREGALPMPNAYELFAYRFLI